MESAYVPPPDRGRLIMAENFLSAVVLAAGSSRRFGPRNKLLQRIGDEPLVCRVVRSALAVPMDEVIVVLGYQAPRIREALAKIAASTHALRYVENPDFARGQSTSVRAGITALSSAVEAALFLPADQPGVSPDLLRRLITAWKKENAGVVVPVFEGRRSSPVLFTKRHFPALAALRGDTGGRRLFPFLEEEIFEIAAEESSEVDDVDIPEDHVRLSLLLHLTMPIL